MRYNEFGRTYSGLRSSKSTFHFFEKYSGYRIISFFPLNILKKLVVKMTLYSIKKYVSQKKGYRGFVTAKILLNIKRAKASKKAWAAQESQKECSGGIME
jgi:hypothetical protein